MKHLYSYNAFLLEKFDITNMYQQQKIVPEIQAEAQRIVDSFYSPNLEFGYDTDQETIPADMRKSKDKVVFWFAKQIKSECLLSLSTDMEDAYKRVEKQEGDELTIAVNRKRFSNIENLYKYFKGESGVVPTNNLSVKTQIKAFYKDNKNAIGAIFDYFFSPIRNQHQKINFTTSTFEEMDAIQREWHKSIKASGKILRESGKIIKEYPDGYYWVDLMTRSAVDEAQAMGHCGTTSADTIISLRRKSEGGYIEPFVTMAAYKNNMDKFTSIVQIKGKNNTKPVAKYHPYIVSFLMDESLGACFIGKSEYSPEDDFHISDLKDTNQIKEMLLNRPEQFDSRSDIRSLYDEGRLDAAFINKYYDLRLSNKKGGRYYKVQQPNTPILDIKCLGYMENHLFEYNLEMPLNLMDETDNSAKEANMPLLSIESLSGMPNSDDYEKYEAWIKSHYNPYLEKVIKPWAEEKGYRLWGY
jgi:hypothetical protein